MPRSLETLRPLLDTARRSRLGPGRVYLIALDEIRLRRCSRPKMAGLEAGALEAERGGWTVDARPG